MGQKLMGYIIHNQCPKCNQPVWRIVAPKEAPKAVKTKEAFCSSCKPGSGWTRGLVEEEVNCEP